METLKGCDFYFGNGWFDLSLNRPQFILGEHVDGLLTKFVDFSNIETRLTAIWHFRQIPTLFIPLVLKFFNFTSLLQFVGINYIFILINLRIETQFFFVLRIFFVALFSSFAACS